MFLDEGMVDAAFFDEDERQLINKYLRLGDPFRRSPSGRTPPSKRTT
jgi:hypothetical protein